MCPNSWFSKQSNHTLCLRGLNSWQTFPSCWSQNMPAFWFPLKELTSTSPSCGMVVGSWWHVSLAMGALMLAWQELQRGVPGGAPQSPQQGADWRRAEAGPSTKPRPAISSFLASVFSALLFPCKISPALWRSKHTGIGGCRKWCVGVKRCPAPGEYMQFVQLDSV